MGKLKSVRELVNLEKSLREQISKETDSKKRIRLESKLKNTLKCIENSKKEDNFEGII